MAQNRSGRYAMPGGEPTTEDLRHDVELTREELAGTVSELAGKADLSGRLAEVKQWAVEPARRHPATTAGVMIGVLALLVVLRRLLSRT